MNSEIEDDGPVKRTVLMLFFIITDVVLPLAVIIGAVLSALWIAGSTLYSMWNAFESGLADIVLLNAPPWLTGLSLAASVAVVMMGLRRTVA